VDSLAMNNTNLRKTALPIAERCAMECFWLECDGMSNLIHIYLDRASLPVTHHRGMTQLTGSYPVSHDWLKLGPWTIDYRLRIWYPEEPKIKVPNGIFLARNFSMTYFSTELLPLLPLTVITELEKSHPAPDWSIFAKVRRDLFEGKMPDQKAAVTELIRCPPSTLNISNPTLN
jgi:hypothetical protein